MDITEEIETKSNPIWFNKIRNLKFKYPQNISCAYLNINTIANKLENFKSLNNNVDIVCFSETNLDLSFPKGQFFIPGYAAPCRLDISKHKKFPVIPKFCLLS